MNISIIVTVLNEEQTIKKLLNALKNQTRKADEIIFVDGGSKDLTVKRIEEFVDTSSSKNIQLLKKNGNRAVGRNYGIKSSKNDVILITDAGCIPDKKWIENMLENLKIGTDVVAGFYDGNAKTSFEKALIPYVLVMPDKADPDNFLPSTRSMLIRKKIWQEIGGFPEKYSDNEDYIFAKKLKKNDVRISFAKNAIVHWMPRKSLKSAFTMFYRFAKGDAEAKIFRPKVLFLFARYTAAFVIMILFFATGSVIYKDTLIIGIILYILWSVVKNYRYVGSVKAFYYLPLIQLTADTAVILGTIKGTLKYGKF